MNASPNANNIPTTIGPALLPMWPMTCGVKYKPSDVPMTHCPPLRAGRGQTVPTPAIRVAAVTNNAPSIHGKGMCIHTANSAPASASANPPSTLNNTF
ncbi:hypothetical protein D3C87_1477560 [compost metagenome]